MRGDEPRVTVTIPVGPEPQHQRWLPEALASVREQTHKVDEILLIDDMAGMPCTGGVTIWHNPWRIGVAASFNFGVARAANELVFMLGSDDWLEPDCIERCVKTYLALPEQERGHTYLFVGVRYHGDDREDKDQFLPCNAAMVTKSLWRLCGGFPVEAATGAPDSALISIFMRHPEAGQYVGVCERKPLYNYRVHDASHTSTLAPWQGVILATRDLVTALWRSPSWLS